MEQITLRIPLKEDKPSAENTYIELPNGVFNGLEDITVSCWVNMSEATGYQRIWDFGFKDGESNFNTTSYMYLIPDGTKDIQVTQRLLQTAAGEMKKVRKREKPWRLISGFLLL